MRAVVQRVSSAEVRVDGIVVGKVGRGLVVMVAAHREDANANAEKMADRIWGLRIFGDEEGKMNRSLRELEPGEAGALVISNFTIYGETSKNRRPSFVESAPFEQGSELVERLVGSLRSLGCPVETGRFGAHMEVELVNDGPVTVILDT